MTTARGSGSLVRLRSKCHPELQSSEGLTRLENLLLTHSCFPWQKAATALGLEACFSSCGPFMGYLSVLLASPEQVIQEKRGRHTHTHTHTYTHTYREVDGKKEEAIIILFLT